MNLVRAGSKVQIRLTDSRCESSQYGEAATFTRCESSQNDAATDLQCESSKNVKAATLFEGPLDLLLHLIRENKLDIKTVRLAQVTSQYLDYIAKLDCLDLELASEFIEVGAILIEIKGKSILPKESEAEEIPDDLEVTLLRRLEEYKILKEASEKLKVIENVDRFYKEPVKIKTEYKFTLDNLNMDGLIAAFTRLLFKVERNAPQITEAKIKMDRWTVADRISSIRTLLGLCETVQFFDLFKGDFTKGEIINTFLAILELLKFQEIRVTQNAQFEDIQIIKGDAYNSNENQNIISEFIESSEIHKEEELINA